MICLATMRKFLFVTTFIVCVLIIPGVFNLWIDRVFNIAWFSWQDWIILFVAYRLCNLLWLTVVEPLFKKEVSE